LAERGSPGLPVRCLELRQLEPTQQGVGRDAGCLRSFIDVALRPDHSSQGPFYSNEHLWLDFHKHQAVVDSQMLALTPKEYGVLALLVEHSGQIVSRDAGMGRVDAGLAKLTLLDSPRVTN
jgi:hypothetical protein